MKLGIPREIRPRETRVAAVPETVRRYIRDGLEVVVESGAGEHAGASDEAYRQVGATVVDSAEHLYQQSDIVLKVDAPDIGEQQPDEIGMLKSAAVLVAPLWPRQNTELVARLRDANITSFALDMMPRISRAQSMDVLSSTSTVSGYKAVLEAANRLPRLMPLMMTAAGTLHPANVLVIGAGVAGLQAIATARRLGAQVKAVDTRPVVQEQVESLGAKFVAMEVEHGESAETAGGYARDLGEDFYRQEQEILAPHVKGSDVVICTALIPGRRAPVLITPEMVESMNSGGVIVDLAAPAGGNCTLTKPDEEVTHATVTILGLMNPAATVPGHASWMFSRNVRAFLEELISDGQVNVDLENQVIHDTLVTRNRSIANEEIRELVEGEPGGAPGPIEMEAGETRPKPSSEAPEIRDNPQAEGPTDEEG